MKVSINCHGLDFGLAKGLHQMVLIRILVTIRKSQRNIQIYHAVAWKKRLQNLDFLHSSGYKLSMQINFIKVHWCKEFETRRIAFEDCSSYWIYNWDFNSLIDEGRDLISWKRLLACSWHKALSVRARSDMWSCVAIKQNMRSSSSFGCKRGSSSR